MWERNFNQLPLVYALARNQIRNLLVHLVTLWPAELLGQALYVTLNLSTYSFRCQSWSSNFLKRRYLVSNRYTGSWKVEKGMWKEDKGNHYSVVTEGPHNTCLSSACLRARGARTCMMAIHCFPLTQKTAPVGSPRKLVPNVILLEQKHVMLMCTVSHG